MDREDVERLVRVEQDVSQIKLDVAALRSLVEANTAYKTASAAILGFVVKLVPFVALGASLFAMTAAGGQ